jgi:glyceraldehyde-3-phosphate dehydrogenase (ferredoxin)
MESHQKVLFVDADSGYYRMERFTVGDFFGPVDLGLHLATRFDSLNIGTGLLAGSIVPGSNRLVMSGFSPCWSGFYISSMGGAGLVFDNLGINMLSIVGRCRVPSVLYLNRTHGEEIEVELVPVDAHAVWGGGRGGVYSLMDFMMERFGGRYQNDPRILATGPASSVTDIGAICSVPIVKGEMTHVDTWAGRGGFGTKMFREHGIAAVIYGGTFIDQDFRDRSVADKWFEEKYQKKLAAKDLEATSKYRFEEKFATGGTFGVNYATLGGSMICFNYRSIYMEEEERLEIHKKLVLDHYLKQFNEETIQPKQQKTCGEPCVAVCKKMHGEYKKDYEPYQTFGPLCGIFDQRAAEKVNHLADTSGFDAISAGGVTAWLMECLHEDLITPEECGVSGKPVFDHKGFGVEADSMHNADIACGILKAILERRGILDLGQGARKLARRLSREKGKQAMDLFLYNAYARTGWMVPNQYWTPGVLSPMAITGKYYMHYGKEFLPPRELGRMNAHRFKKELIMDNMGTCRFHRGWAEEMLPEMFGSLFGMKEQYIAGTGITATRIGSRNASIFWESERNTDFVYTFLKRRQVVEKDTDKGLLEWIGLFERDRKEAALAYWYEIHKGITESLREF